MSGELVRAAGGVVWRPGEGGADEVLLVHRSRYDDWTIPKGKLDPGESWEQAAVREVFEETAVVPVLGAELESITYEDHNGHHKQVRYWEMVVAAELGWEPDDEITGRVWLPIDVAERRLTYARDVTVLTSFRGLRSRMD